jgi:hypothetical protein
MVFLIDLLSDRYAPIQDSLLLHLGPAEIARLTCTCRAFGCLWPTLMKRDYNINRHLRNLFMDPRAFRSAQAKSNALIMDGLAADYSNFVTRENSQCGELIIFVDKHHITPLVEYIEAEGYERWNPRPADPEMEKLVLSYRKKCPIGARSYWNISLNYNEQSPIFRILEVTDTTLYLRFLSWNKAYVLFPHEMFVEENCRLLSRDDWDISGYLTTWHDTQQLRHQAQTSDDARVGNTARLDRRLLFLLLGVAEDGPDHMYRRIGDKHTWILNLDVAGVTVPDTPDAVLESTMFEVRRLPEPFVMTYGKNKERYPRHELNYQQLRHPVLKHQYLAPSPDGRQLDGKQSSLHRKMKILIEKLDRWTLGELEKIPDADRPLEYWHLQYGDRPGGALRYRFALPAAWTFYDDEVLEELKDAWEKRDEVSVEAEEPADKGDVDTSTETALV